MLLKWVEENLEDCKAKLDSVSEVKERAAGVSESEDIVLSAGDDIIDKYPDESASALGEVSDLNRSFEIPDDVGAAGAASESEGEVPANFRRFIVDRSVDVSSWRTFIFLPTLKCLYSCFRG